MAQIARRLTIAADLVMADQRKAIKLVDHVLIIIWNHDFHIRPRTFACSAATKGRRMGYLQ